MKSLSISLLIILSFFANAVNCNAQNSFLDNRFNVGISISDCPLDRYRLNPSSEDHSNILGLFVDYKLAPTFSAGIYGGYNDVWQSSSVWTGSGFLTQAGLSSAYHFGLHYKAHLMPLIVPGQQSRIDLYTKAKLGRVIIGGDDNGGNPPKSFTDYGVYAGFSVYLFGNFGVFTEIGFGVVSEKTFGLTKRF